MTRTEWKGISFFAVGVMLIFLAQTLPGCKGGPSGPSPTPTPTPTPTPVPFGPVSTMGTQFIQNGVGIILNGLSFCCGGGYGWPMMDDQAITTLESIGANWGMIRTGPFTRFNEGPEFEGYLFVDGKYDLTQWNPLFWDYVHHILATANEAGIIVEVDVIDAWDLKHAPGSRISPWDPTINHQGMDARGCAVTEAPPREVHLNWIRKLVQETGPYVVIYQIGNETSVCDSTREWEEGVYRAVKEALALNGYHDHPVGSNHPEVFVGDYTTEHGFGIPMSWGVPRELNESNNRDRSPAEWQELIIAGQEQGANMLFWRGPMGESGFQEMLDWYRGR